MNGLLGGDFEDPKTQGLLGLAMAMLAGSGPSPVRRTFGSILGESGQAGINQYRQQKVLKQRDEELARRNRLVDMQLKKLQADLDEESLLGEAAKGAYQSPTAEANSAAFASTGLPLGRIENAAPQEAALKTATGGISPESFLQRAMSLGVNPLKATQVAQGLGKLEPTQVVPPGAALVRGGKPIFTNTMREKTETAPTSYREWTLAGSHGTFQDWLNKRAAASRNSVSVQLPASEKAYDSELGKGMAGEHLGAYKGAMFGTKAIDMLDRLDKFVKNATGGPIAAIEVWARNFASEYGFPLDKVNDASNAMLTAEFSSFLADQIINGGRGITDEDVRVISKSIPSFGSGIPKDQLPAFMAQLRRIAQQKVSYWNSVYSGMSPAQKSKFAPIGVKRFEGRKDPRTMSDEELFGSDGE